MSLPIEHFIAKVLISLSLLNTHTHTNSLSLFSLKKCGRQLSEMDFNVRPEQAVVSERKGKKNVKMWKSKEENEMNYLLFFKFDRSCQLVIFLTCYFIVNFTCTLKSKIISIIEQWRTCKNNLILMCNCKMLFVSIFKPMFQRLLRILI